MHHLTKRVQAHYAGSTEPSATGRSSTSRGTTPSTASRSASRRRGRAARDQRLRRRRPASCVPGFAELARTTARPPAAAGSTRGVYADGVNQARRRDPGDIEADGGWVSPEWGWAWPANRRILYNRASRRPAGQAVVASARSTSGGTRSRASGRATTSRTSRSTSARTTAPPDDARGHGRDLRRRPVHHDGRRPRLAVRALRPARRPDARPTTSRSSRRSTTCSTPQVSANPAAIALDRAGQPVDDARRPALPASWRRPSG